MPSGHAALVAIDLPVLLAVARTRYNVHGIELRCRIPRTVTKEAAVCGTFPSRA